MNTDQVWANIDAQRAQAADLLDGLDDTQWAQPSLCAGWRVVDVAAHLTLAHTKASTAAVWLLRSGGSFNRMIRLSAIRQADDPLPSHAAWLRAAAGNRAKAVGVTEMEPLLDILVHQQDIARPLGIDVAMPIDAAVACAQRTWAAGFPFWARRRLRGMQLRATDADLVLGEGTVVRAPIAEILMLLTGRSPNLHLMEGPGRDRVAHMVLR